MSAWSEEMFFFLCMLLLLCIKGEVQLASDQSTISTLQQAIDDLRHEQSGTAGLVASMSAQLLSIKAEMKLRESDLVKVESKIKSLEGENALLRNLLNSTFCNVYENPTSGVLQDLTNDVIALKDDVTSIMSKHGDNSGTNSSIVDSIWYEMNKMSGDISSVKTELTELRSNISTLEANEPLDLTRNLTDILNRLHVIETAVNNSGSIMAQTTSVFYRAYLTHDTTVPNNGALIFDNVTANVGNGYDVKTGIFTAPVEGKYLLWANVLAQSRLDAVLDVFLFQNSHIISASYSKVSFMMGHNLAPTLTISHLRAGDKLVYRIPVTITITGEMYSNYGGVLLP